MAPLPPHNQRHPFLRYQGLEYSDADVADFKERMVMEHRYDAGVVVFASRAWGRLFDTKGPLVRELILKFLSTLDLVSEEMESPGFARYWIESERMIPGKGDLHDYWMGISTDGYFLGPPPSYTLIRDLVLRLCHRMMTHNITGRSRAPEKVTVTDLFYLRGLDVRSVNIPDMCHAGDPEVSYWLKGRGANLRAKKDGLELVINQGWSLKLKDALLLLDPSLICYKQ
ncbi:hypothetical protein Tco_1066239 [Tanacetum coccineum]|uniref:Uncharacterized protein n=1 Tax=Tanacetum coccineum TaxID=301880 RepID=A0ABQ5HB84_9ASTR